MGAGYTVRDTMSNAGVELSYRCPMMSYLNDKARILVLHTVGRGLAAVAHIDNTLLSYHLLPPLLPVKSHQYPR